MIEHKQIIVMRKDLNMRKGKLVAQGAHASMAAILNHAIKTDSKYTIDLSDTRLKEWLTGRFKKICVYVNSEQELLDLFNKAKEQGFICSLITDAGLTEFGGIPTNTAVAIGPDTDEKLKPLTGHLPLY